MTTWRQFEHPAQRADTGLRRRHLLGAAVLVPLGACGGGGGGDGGGGAGGGGGGGGGGGSGASGRIVVKESNLWVVNAANGQGTSFNATSSNVRPGVGVSRNGYIVDVWGYTGGDTWKITLRTLAGAQTAEYTINGAPLLGLPTSAAVLNADATRMAYSVNEMTSATNSTRIDRVYVNNLGNGALVGTIDNVAEPVFADNGELFARRGTRLRAFNSALVDQGALSITVAERFGAYSASPDGRYIAYENGSRISVLDRSTGSTWNATDLAPRGHSAPVFSPDGGHLAFLRAGALALRYVNVMPFVPNATRTVDDSMELKSAGGQGYAAEGRIGWAR